MPGSYATLKAIDRSLFYYNLLEQQDPNTHFISSDGHGTNPTLDLGNYSLYT